MDRQAILNNFVTATKGLGQAVQQLVTLKNGTQEVRQLVAITMMSLRKLFDNDPMVAYDLVMLCRDTNYKPWGSAPDKLVALGLASRREEGELSQQEVAMAKRQRTEGMTVHESIRNIVLSAATGEGMDIVIRDPIAGESP